MTTRDEFTQWDAAYVLGALSAADRERYEEHLAGCDRCRAAVAELAGMPGLLAQVPPAEALAMSTPEELGAASPPVSLMPVLPREPALVLTDRPSQVRRRRWLAPVAAAAAALLIGGVGGYAVSHWGDVGGRVPGGGATSALGAAQRLAFAPVADTTMQAVVDLVPLRSGTEVRVECQYTDVPGSGGSASGSATGTATRTPQRPGADNYANEPPRYSLWVLDTGGRGTQIKDWPVKPDTLMHPVGVSPLDVDQIRAIEIRGADGRPLMRAAVS